MWIGIIFWLSSLHTIPNIHIPMADKIAHASFYGVLCGLFFRAFYLQERFQGLKLGAVWAAWTFTILYGITDEIHQLYVWGRSSDVRDIAADAVGGLIFVVLLTLYRKRKPAATGQTLRETQV